MPRIAYVNGRYMPVLTAAVSINDRAFAFGDGVYEVCEVRGGALIDEMRHLARLERSLAALRISWPIGESGLRTVMRETLRRNRVREGLVYLQISRGVARRDHGFPDAGVKPGLVVTARPLDLAAMDAKASDGVAVITLPDGRWAHPHLKTLQLLPNVLAKQAAREAGAYEAWFVDREGYITDGASTNAWIVTRDAAIVTRQADDTILHGVARATLLDVARKLALRLEERRFTPAEVYLAREAFFSSATTIAMPVVTVDGRTIADGRPGSMALALRSEFHSVAQKS